MRNFSMLLIFSVLFPCTYCHLTYIAIRLPLKGNRSPPGAPWPMPHEWQIKSETLAVNIQSLQFTSSLESCDIISSAIKRYKKILHLQKKSSTTTGTTALSSLNIAIEDGICPGYPHLNMDETYTLTIEENSVLKSKSVWGALRGLETFSQLLYENNSELTINKTIIKDEPRFGHRGIMLDTARHFIPMSIIKKNLDAMSYNKMNVFHWHIVDDQSFPYESKVFPELSKKGAYSPNHVYSQKDIRELIEYARLRGIRIIPEFDTPGHSQSWGKAFKYLLTPCWVNGKPGVAKPNFHGAYELFNPTENATYHFLKTFFTEIKSVFKDPFIHLGMDEGYLSCWKSNPNITSFMKRNGIKSHEDLQLYYVEKLLNIVGNMKRSYVIWQEPVEQGALNVVEAWASLITPGYAPAIVSLASVDDKLLLKVKNDTIVEIWKGDEAGITWQDYMTNISRLGYKTILSSCWYLNYISYGQDWRKYYLCEPYNFTGTQTQYENIIGGEATMWAEYVDGTNLLSRLWPRASAVAERLWSRKEVNDAESAKFRLDQQRCRMLRRGIPAEPILDGYCGDYEFGSSEYGGIYNDNSINPVRDCNANHASSNNRAVSFTFFTCLVLILIN